MPDAPRILPAWAEELRKRYLRGEASVFLLHGNVFDVVLANGKAQPLVEFLTDSLLKDSKDTIVQYNLATGVRFTKRAKGTAEDLAELLAGGRDKVLAALEKIVTSERKVGIVMEYAEALAPAGDPSFQTEGDRAA